MRIFRAVFGLSFGLPLLLSPVLLAAERPQNVVAQYQFIGATELARSTNIPAAKAVFSQKSTANFEGLIHFHTAVEIADTLHISTNDSTLVLFRPLLANAVRVESIGSFGGISGHPLNAVLAFHVGPERIELWQKNLKTAFTMSPEALSIEGFSGWQWNKGSKDSFWMIPARDWIVLGRGEDLASVRATYLGEIAKTGRPAPALSSDCFQADVDWIRWTNWFSLDSCPFKLGATKFNISAQKGGFYMVGKVTYPEAVSWQPQPMNLPTTLVREPLLSFATGQDVEPFLKSNKTLSKFSTNPFRDQFYFWSMRDLAFQSQVVWPAVDPVATTKALGTEAIEELNPVLEKLSHTELQWKAATSQLLWSGLPVIRPYVGPAPGTNVPFMMASLFFSKTAGNPAPQTLWDQIRGQTNLVFYDWELTGPRVKHLLNIIQVVPILRMLDIGPAEPFKLVDLMAKPGGKGPAHAVDPRLSVEEAWLADLAGLLPNTVTEVTRTAPNELTIVRHSPFVFSSLELVLLSHWLSDTPAGPIDWKLLPHAKMTGPGVPH